ncbi:MAG: Phospho-2-dehydro-3-deoxyheptonate aldolase, Tyr-sensitive [Candidatus Anoxychlamydiales bacterium]|nr:Phospho-2-dehydro-3-deoxyheptonate aldolase, Tyr-sensitive [Candidatus Anoxychlamydiales bacterium]
MKKICFPTYKGLKQKLTLNSDNLKFLEDSKKICKNIFYKNSLNKLIIFTGPCSIHSEKEALLYAEKLKILQKDLKNIFLIMRAYFEKPRSENSWKGFLYDPNLDNSFDIETGLKKTRNLLIDITKMRVPIATEIVDPNVFNYFDDLITWGFIGARTSASSLHRHFASSLKIPIGFKNALDGDIKIAINGAFISKNKQNFISVDENGKICQTKSNGNKLSHIVLRGSKTSINYDEKSLNNTLKLMKEKNQNFPIIIDCSHGNSQYTHLNQINAFEYTMDMIKEKKYPIIGIMLESNLKAGKQALDLLNLRFGKSITDSCISFEETKDLIKTADEKLSTLDLHQNHR